MIKYILNNFYYSDMSLVKTKHSLTILATKENVKERHGEMIVLVGNRVKEMSESDYNKHKTQIQKLIEHSSNFIREVEARSQPITL